MLDDLVCEACGGAPLRRSRLQSSAGDGPLECERCARQYPIVNGVSRFAGDLGDLSATASSYGYQWSGFWSGQLR